jgi:hypothetical protein
MTLVDMTTDTLRNEGGNPVVGMIVTATKV